MSALTDRDANAAPTSNPAAKQPASGEENKLQEEGQHKSVLEQKSVGASEYVGLRAGCEEELWALTGRTQQTIRLALRRHLEPG